MPVFNIKDYDHLRKEKSIPENNEVIHLSDINPEILGFTCIKGKKRDCFKMSNPDILFGGVINSNGEKTFLRVKNKVHIRHNTVNEVALDLYRKYRIDT